MIQIGINSHIEICCNSKVSARHAAEGGATRIELCRCLELDGLTPYEEDITYCVKELGLRTHVLLRPREGNFYYSDDEYQEICRDVCRCRALGAAAVVVGFLNADHSVDVRRTREVVDLAEGMEVTFHRAFDEVADPTAALEDIISCGCSRLLTSGCQTSAEMGSMLIRRLVEQADGRITILAGAGITPDNVQTIIQTTGVKEVHASCKRRLSGGVLETDVDVVRKLIRNNNNFND